MIIFFVQSVFVTDDFAPIINAIGFGGKICQSNQLCL